MTNAEFLSADRQSSEPQKVRAIYIAQPHFGGSGSIRLKDHALSVGGILSVQLYKLRGCYAHGSFGTAARIPGRDAPNIIKFLVTCKCQPRARARDCRVRCVLPEHKRCAEPPLQGTRQRLLSRE